MPLPSSLCHSAGLTLASGDRAEMVRYLTIQQQKTPDPKADAQLGFLHRLAEAISTAEFFR